MRLLNRLIEPTSGQVMIDGEIFPISLTKHCAKLGEQISMVFQSFALMPHMNVIDNTAFGMELSGIPKEERHKKAMNALEQVNLENGRIHTQMSSRVGCVSVSG